MPQDLAALTGIRRDLSPVARCKIVLCGWGSRPPVTETNPYGCLERGALAHTDAYPGHAVRITAACAVDYPALPRPL